MDAPTMALAACVGCGCAGGACYMADEQSPVYPVKMAISDVYYGFFGDGYGAGRYNGSFYEHR